MKIEKHIFLPNLWSYQLEFCTIGMMRISSIHLHYKSFSRICSSQKTLKFDVNYFVFYSIAVICLIFNHLCGAGNININFFYFLFLFILLYLWCLIHWVYSTAWLQVAMQQSSVSFFLITLFFYRFSYKFIFIILAFTYLGFYFHCIFKLRHIGKEVKLFVIVETLYIDIIFCM